MIKSSIIYARLFALGIVTPWGGDALARLRRKSGAGAPQARTGRLAI